MGNILKKFKKNNTLVKTNLLSSKSSSSKSSSSKSSSSTPSSSKSLSSKSLSSKSLSSKLLTPKLLLKESFIQNKIVDQNYMNERYKILKKLGEGLNGSVYLVEDTTNHKKYAYKIQKIFENDLLDNYQSLVVRQIDFYNNIIKNIQTNLWI